MSYHHLHGTTILYLQLYRDDFECACSRFGSRNNPLDASSHPDSLRLPYKPIFKAKALLNAS